MASEAVVVRTLQAIANMFNKGSWWVQDSTKMWALQLADVSDEDLIQGTKDCLRKAKKLPTVANLRDVIEARPGSTLGQPTEIKACGACGGTGCREMARWKRDRSKVVAFFGVAACDCPKGQRLAMGAFQDWRDVRAAWERDPFTAKDDQDRPIVFWGTRERPHLGESERLTPDTLAKRQQRRQNANTDNRSTGSWRQVADRSKE